MVTVDAVLLRLLTLATAAALIAIAVAGGGFDVVDRHSAGLLLWWAIGLGALALPRLPGPPAAAGIAVTIVAALIPVWIAIGLGSTLSTERTATELARWVTHLAPIVLLGWVLPRRAWPSVAAGLIAGAVVVCGIALEHRLSEGIPAAVVFSNTTARLAVPFGYWNALGSWAVVTGLLLLAVSAHQPRLWLRAAALGALPMVITVAYLTYSRSSIAAVALGLIVAYVFASSRWTLALHALLAVGAGVACITVVQANPQIADATGTAGAGSVLRVVVGAGIVLALAALATGRLELDRIALPRTLGRAIGGVTIAVALAGLVAGGVTRGDELWDRFSTVERFDSADQSQRLSSLNNGARVAQWRTALDAWEADRGGSGAGTFEFTYNLQGEDGQFVLDAHSAYLEALSEQGTVGLVLLAALTLGALWAAITAVGRVDPAGEQRGLVAGAAAGLAAFLLGTAFDWFWEVGALALLGTALLGLLIAAGAPAGPRDPGARGSSRSQWPLRLGLAALAAICVLTQLPGLVGTSDVRRSQRALAAGDLAAARSYADQAIDTLPWASSPFLQRALVDEQAGAYDAARDGLQLAIERDPYDWRLPLVLARVEARAGDADAALAAYRDAKQLRPRGQFFR